MRSRVDLAVSMEGGEMCPAREDAERRRGAASDPQTSPPLGRIRGKGGSWRRHAMRLLPKSRITRLIMLFTLLYFACSFYRHLVFYSSAWDLGIFSQAVWQYSRLEMGFNTVRGVPCLLGDHFHPSLMAFAPLFRVWADPVMLLLAQAFLTALAAWPIYRLAEMRLGSPRRSTAMALAYLCFWGVLSAIIFDFHPIMMMLPLLAFSCYFLERGNTFAMMVMVLAMLLVEETMVPTVAAFGLYVFLRKRYFLGFSIAALSLGWFLAVTRLIMPGINLWGGEYVYWQQYAHIAPSMGAAALKLLTRPWLLARYLFWPPVKMLVLAAMVLPFLGLPLLGRFSVVGIPYLLQRFLSSFPGHWSPACHYNALFGAVFAVAAVEGLALLEARRKDGRGLPLFSRRLDLDRACGAMRTLGALVFLAYFAGFWIYLCPLEKVPQALNGYRLLREIPGDAPVVAQSHILPHLSLRDEVFVYCDGELRQGLSHTNLELIDFLQERRPLDDAAFVVINPRLNYYPLSEKGLEEGIEKLKSDPRFSCRDFGRGWLLFARVQ